MKAEILVRTYQEGDEHAIVAGFEQAFAKPMSLATWQWKFLHGDQPPSVVVGEWQDDQSIVGQYAVMPMDVQVEGRLLAAGQPVDVFCLRRPGSVERQIYRRCYDQLVGRFCRPAGRYQLLFGFPNRRALRQGQLQMGYPDNPPQVPVLSRPVAGRLRSRVLRVLRGGRLPSGPSCSADDIDQLWQRARGRYPVAVARDGRWFQRRFASHPEIRYLHLLVHRGGQPRVWAALSASGQQLSWVDLVWDGQAEDDVLEMERQIHQLARRGGFRESVLWLLGDARVESILEAAGWQVDRAAELWFSHRFYGPLPMPASRFAERFYVTMAVSDHV
jgi:hypothetical protein